MTVSSYLDYNATSPVYPDIAKAMQDILLQPSNPSSVHSYGRKARKHLEDARKTIAETLSAWPNEIIFTASGTEANITALQGFPTKNIFIAATEHSSVLNARSDASLIEVDANGIIQLDRLDEYLSKTPDALVSVMLANNETGVIQPIKDISTLCKKHNSLLHCDAVQGLGKVTFDFTSLGVDMMTISSHKAGGPVGAAALIARRDLPFKPLMTGGGQELNRRAGTENLAAITGFAMAVEKATDLSHMQSVRQWLTDFESQAMNNGGIIFGKEAERLPNTCCIAMPDVGNEVQLMDFDMKGFAVSAGSACSSGRIEVSHVLTAMGIEKAIAATAIRISAGWQTTQKDIADFSESWSQLQMRLKNNKKSA